MRDNRLSLSHFKNLRTSARFNTGAGLFTTKLRRLLLRQAICIALIFKSVVLTRLLLSVCAGTRARDDARQSCGTADGSARFDHQKVLSVFR